MNQTDFLQVESGHAEELIFAILVLLALLRVFRSLADNLREFCVYPLCFLTHLAFSLQTGSAIILIRLKVFFHYAT